MTVAEAGRAAYRAGQQSGDTGLFASWLEGKGLSSHGNVLRARLRKEYDAGVESNFEPKSVPTRRTTPADLNRQFLKRTAGKKKPAKEVEAERAEARAVGIDTAKMRAHLAKGGTVAEYQAGQVRNPDITDRAHRYRANELMPTAGKRCLFCESTRFLVPDHWDGHPDHTHADNLEVLCKSCNTAKGNAFKKAGRGRLTKQYNPTKSGGASNVGEWINAVGAIIPRKGAKYAGSNYGINSHMKTRDAVDMIRATPKHKREEFAALIRRGKRGRASAAAQERWNPAAALIDSPEMEVRYRHSVKPRGGGRPSWTSWMYYPDIPTVNGELAGLQATADLRRTTSNWEIHRKGPGGWEHFEHDKGTIKPRPKSKRNPEDSAAALYKSFHGKPATETLEISEEVHSHEHLAVLGRAVECWIDTPTGLRACIEFDQSDEEPIMVCSAENGRQLYLEGGDQAVDLVGLKMDGEDWVKDRMVLGQFSEPEPKTKGKDRRRHNLTYNTKKDFDAFENIDYQHDLGEDTGVRPYLEYDPRNQHLYITGGQYFIKQPLLETSPGIEN